MSLSASLSDLKPLLALAAGTAIPRRGFHLAAHEDRFRLEDSLLLGEAAACSGRGEGGEDELEDLGYGFRLLFVNGFVNEPGTELSDF